VKTYRIATIPGDGIGKEVVPAGRRVLEALAQRQSGFGFEFTEFGWGGDWYRRHGVMMPDDGLDALRGMDAILFGSAGDPDIPDHVTLWGLRLKICQGFDQYANVRPTRILPGIDAPLKRCGPADLDWVIVRENSEGEYAGVGGRVHKGHPIEAATDVSMMTRAGVERIMRFAFRLARSRPRKQLTVVTKSNAQRHAMVMWDEIAVEISREFPDVAWDKELVDAATARMVNRPGSLDTLVALIDAVDLGAAPGSVALLERDDLPAGGGTTHHAPLALVMEVLAHMTGADVFLLAIQPQSTFLGGPVSVEVATAAEGLASIIAGALATRVAFGEVVRGAVAEDSSPC